MIKIVLCLSLDLVELSIFIFALAASTHRNLRQTLVRYVIITVFLSSTLIVNFVKSLFNIARESPHLTVHPEKRLHNPSLLFFLRNLLLEWFSDVFRHVVFAVR